MRFILEINNYHWNRLYVDTDARLFALDTHRYCTLIDSSKVDEFKRGFTLYNSKQKAPFMVVQNKKQFYKFLNELKDFGYEEIKFITKCKKEIIL